MAIMIDGKSLTLSQVEAVARGYEKKKQKTPSIRQGHMLRKSWTMEP